MKQRVTLIFLAYFFGLFLLSWTASAKAQVAENSDLFQAIMRLDQQLFEQGFNQCNLPRFEALIPLDLTFFHDKGGPQDRAEFINGFKKNVCANPEGKPIRTLVSGSTRIYPMEDNGVLYGAVQMGEHTFHLKGKSLSTDGYTVAKFTHLWFLNKGQWQLKSAISYDHQQKFEKMLSSISTKKTATKPYTIFNFSIAPYSLHLDYQATN